MIFLRFDHRSEAVFSSPIAPLDEPTLSVEPKVSEAKQQGRKYHPISGTKISEKSSGMGIEV